MAELIISALVGALIDATLEPSCLYKVIGVKRVVRNLLKQVEILKGFLGNAEGRQEEDSVVRKWMSDLNDLAYEAEEIIEKQSDRKQHKGQIPKWNVFKRLSRAVLDDIALIRTVAEIEGLTRKISELNSRMQIYGIERQETTTTTTTTTTDPAFSGAQFYDAREAEKSIVGLDSDINAVVNQLMSETEGSPRVIGVCGIDGLGKTTLVKEALRRNDVKEHFDDIVWAFLGPPGEIRVGDVLKKMLLHLLGNDDIADEERHSIHAAQVPLDVLSERISRILEEKRCLVVLDDFRTPATWDPLFQTAFSSIRSANSSTKLVLTTCDPNVLKCVDRQGFLHQPRCPNSEERWQLFQSKVASTGTGIKGRNKMVMAKMMSCVGLPLTIHLLGGLFACDHFQSFKWYLAPDICYRRFRQSDELEAEVHTVLKLSYSTLPQCLRSCLLEMSSHFAEGEDIPASDLIKFWVDKGICKHEDVAQSCLDKLVKRGLIQVVEKEGFPTLLIKTCQLHSLIRDFYCKLAGDASSEHHYRLDTWASLCMKIWVLHIMQIRKFRNDRNFQ